MDSNVNPASTLTVADAQATRWDVVVIGAGVAGSVAAFEIARTGHRVLLIDKRHFPRRKVCGACLNRFAWDQLELADLSSAVSELGGCELSSFSISAGSQSVTLPLPGGRAVSRELLDAALVREAIRAGSHFLSGMTAHVGDATDVVRHVLITENGRQTRLEARAIIVASGLESVGSSHSDEWTTEVDSSSRLGAGCLIDDKSSDYAAGTIWMAVGTGGYLGLVRVENGRLNIAAAFDRHFLRQHRSPSVAAEQLLRTTKIPVPDDLFQADWQGTIALTRSTSPVASRRVFLIGDAASYEEPFTGEGMAWAVLTARNVVPCVIKSLYQRDWLREATLDWTHEHRKLIQNRQRLCRVSTRLLRSKILVKLGISVFASWPWLATHFIERMNAPTAHGRLAHECTL